MIIFLTYLAAGGLQTIIEIQRENFNKIVQEGNSSEHIPLLIKVDNLASN